MKNRVLIVFVDETWPESKPSAHWVLLDETASLIEEGVSPPVHWPAAEDHVVVLAGTQTVLHTLTIPKARHAERDGLLRYALEDRFVKDMDQQHLTVVSARSEGASEVCQVLAASRIRLRQVLGYFRSIERPLSQMVSELCLPAMWPESDCWHVVFGPSGAAVMITDPINRYACDATALPFLLQRELDAASEKGTAPGWVQFHPGKASSAGQILPDRMGLAGIPCKEGAPYQWWLGLNRVPSLLHSEFTAAQKRTTFARSLRLPALVAGLAGTALVLSVLFEVLQLNRQLAELDQHIDRVFSAALPNTPAVLPLEQLSRALDEQRRAHGRLAADDFLALLHAATVNSGFPVSQTIRAASYANGGLTLSFDAQAGLDLAHLLTRLEFMGYRAYALPGDTPTLFIEHARK